MVKKIWNKSIRKILSVTLSVSMVVPTNIMYAADMSGGGYENRAGDREIELTNEDIQDLYQKVDFQRQSVHDPSITVAEDGTYYVFGSHMGVAKTTDLQNWSDTSISNENESNAYYGVRDANLKINRTSLTSNTCIRQTNPLQGKNAEKVTITYIINWDEAAAKNGWDGIFSFYDESSKGRVSFQTAPYLCYNSDGNGGNTSYIDLKADAWCASNCEKGKDYLFEYVITKDSIEVFCNGSKIEAFAEVVRGGSVSEGYQAILDALNTYSTFTVGIGKAVTGFWDTETCTVSITIDTGTDKNVTPVSYKDAFQSGGYGLKMVQTADGNMTAVDFGSFPASDWNTAITANPSAGKVPWSVQGNMWAPDIIYNPVMKKWCMYLSLNGNAWNTVVVLLTSDAIEGPYVYEAPIIYSGFTSGGVTSYDKTDLSLAINNGNPLSSLPARYNNLITGVASDGTATSDGHGSYGTYWPHAIDPSVFYDEQGELWMNYGSWSGGIYMIKLDKNTGLRDYTVNYPYEVNGAAADASKPNGNVTSDPYFGKKVAGGWYLSGEGPYIEKIGNYYYLFISYGFYSPTGGYNMRIFRSENPDGPYLDVNGENAIYESANKNGNFKSNPSRGLQLMGNYQWDTMPVAEVAQGHNSAFVDKDGNAYVIYHTKFADGTAGHQLRVHQLYQNEDGWIVAAPYEYAGETINDENIKNEAIPAEQIAGNYRLIVHQYLNPKAADNGTVEQNLDIVKPVNITLNADGTISGAYTGKWVEKEGTAYATITINNTEYKGVFTEQTIDGSNVKTLCFSAVNVSGECIWGSKSIPDNVAVAKNVINFKSSLTDNTYTNLDLSVNTTDGVTVTWTSSNTDVITNDGKVTPTDKDIEVIMTAKISKGD